MDTATPATREFACSTCGRKYQHSSHLRRHEGIHSANTRFRCTHCDKWFARRDVWRKHSLKCSTDEAGKRQDPSPAKRGQKPRACDACFRSRAACNNEDPCSRCLTRRVECTFDRLPKAVHQVAKDGSKTSVSFLLNLVDPTAASMVACLASDSDDTPREPPSPEATTSTADGGDSGEPTTPPEGLLAGNSMELAIDEAFFPCYLSFWAHGDDVWPATPGHDFEFSPVLSLPPPFPDQHPSLAIIIAELQTHHNTLIHADKTYTDRFGLDLANHIFTPSNLETFITAYFNLIHPDFPFTHRPSFNLATCPPPLLLAFFLAGAMRIPHKVSLRTISRLAEEYTFAHLSTFLISAHNPSPDLIPALQAAVLVHCSQYATHCATTRRRNRVTRLPILVSAIRSLGFTSLRHSDTQPSFGEFIRTETALRIAVYTVLADWHQSGMFLVPALTTIYEMTGGFPCLPELWEADSPEAFQRVVETLGTGCWDRGASVREGVEALMGEGAFRFPLRDVTVYDLHLLVYASHAVVRGALLMGLLPASSGTLLRAAERWQGLWDGVVKGMGEEGARRCGLARHSPELAWLMRRMIDGKTDERLVRSRYLAGVAHDGLDELYSLIKIFKDL